MSQLFVFEGGEGCGKTTQVAAVAKELSKLGYSVVGTRQPGDTKVGAELRAIIKNPKYFDLPAMTRRLIFAADAVAHNVELAKATVDVILCDRWCQISNFAYGVVEGCNEEELERVAVMLNLASKIHPDLVFILDVDPKIGWRRTDHEDLADQDYPSFEAVNDQYATLAGKAAAGGKPTSVIGVSGDAYYAQAINADLPVEEVTRRIMDGILDVLECDVLRDAIS